jgi:hypothetical protein
VPLMWENLLTLGDKFKKQELNMEQLRHIDAGIRRLGYPQWPLTGSRQDVQDYLNDVAAILQQVPGYVEAMSDVTWTYGDLTDLYTGKCG